MVKIEDVLKWAVVGLLGYYAYRKFLAPGVARTETVTETVPTETAPLAGRAELTESEKKTLIEYYQNEALKQLQQGNEYNASMLLAQSACLEFGGDRVFPSDFPEESIPPGYVRLATISSLGYGFVCYKRVG